MVLGLELSQWSYVAMLIFVIASSWWLELVFKIKVLRRPLSLARAILPVALFFLAWDALAIKHKHWAFDPRQILGIFGPFDIPLEEYLFFLIIPIAALLTLEGVTVVMKKVKR